MMSMSRRLRAGMARQTDLVPLADSSSTTRGFDFGDVYFPHFIFASKA